LLPQCFLLFCLLTAMFQVWIKVLNPLWVDTSTRWQVGSPSLAIKDMQIKNTLRFHLILVRIASIKNTTNNKCWWGCKEKVTLLHFCWECKQYNHFGKQYGGYLKH
jgi:hypothetical protein